MGVNIVYIHCKVIRGIGEMAVSMVAAVSASIQEA